LTLNGWKSILKDDHLPMRNVLLSFLALLALAVACPAQNVGIGTSTPNPTAKLDVSSTVSGFLPPRMTTVQRNAIAAPAEGLVIYNLTIHCLEFFDGTVWVSLCGSTTCYRNCAEILAANPASTSGVYTIDPDCAGPMAPMQCQCDMTTDGGGWTLVLNYQHLTGTNPDNQVRTTDLPLQGATALGVDESGTAFWGHAGNSLMTALTFAEVRFYGITSNNPRTLHFKTSDAGTLSHFRTGLGDCLGISSSFTALAGHTAFLPASQDGSLSNQGDYAMCNHPFFEGCTRHWITGVSDCSGAINPFPITGRRWELDDMSRNCCGGPFFAVTPSTWHQIWIR
jgi:hypothetical protein